MPKYLLLIHEDESAFAAAGQASFDEVMAAHMSFATELDELGGKSLGGEALQPLATATFLRGTRTAGVSHRRQPERPTSRSRSAATTSSRPRTTTTSGASPSAARHRTATSRSARSGTSPRADLT